MKANNVTSFKSNTLIVRKKKTHRTENPNLSVNKFLALLNLKENHLNVSKRGTKSENGSYLFFHHRLWKWSSIHQDISLFLNVVPKIYFTKKVCFHSFILFVSYKCTLLAWRRFSIEPILKYILKDKICLVRIRLKIIQVNSL